MLIPYIDLDKTEKAARKSKRGIVILTTGRKIQLLDEYWFVDDGMKFNDWRFEDALKYALTRNS